MSEDRKRLGINKYSVVYAKVHKRRQEDNIKEENSKEITGNNVK